MGPAGKVRCSLGLTSGQRPRSRARVRGSSSHTGRRLRSLQRWKRRLGERRWRRRGCADARALVRAGAAGYRRPSRRECPSPQMRGPGAWPREPTPRFGVAGTGPRRCPPWVPTQGRGHGAQPRAGPEAGGLVASPAFPWSVWLGSWALPEGKAFCVGIRVLGNPAVGFRARRGERASVQSA